MRALADTILPDEPRLRHRPRRAPALFVQAEFLCKTGFLCKARPSPFGPSGFAVKVGFDAKVDRLMQKSLKVKVDPKVREFDPPLDKGIERAVLILRKGGIETFESCQGGKGHSYAEPAIRFHGERSEGFKALAIAMQNALPVTSLRRVWPVNDGEPTGPCWELVFLRE